MTPYRTVRMIAKQEGVSKPSVYQWIYSGQLKSTRVGAQHRVTDEAWKEFLLLCNARHELKADAAGSAISEA